MPMMIDDVVEKARKRAIDKRADADWKWIHGRLNSDKEIKAAENLEQLAEWLEELKELRKIKEDYSKGMQTSYATFMYNKAIDDFVEQITLPLSSEKQIEEIVNRLKNKDLRR